MIFLKKPKSTELLLWKRSKTISGDKATSESALKDVLENCQLINPDQDIIFHQCTSPLLSINSIEEALIKFENTNSSCVFTVQEEYNPIWSFDDEKINIINAKDLIRKGRQERKPLLIETGGLYVIRKQIFMKNFNRFGETPLPLTVSKIEAIDIDEETDLLIAKKLNEI